MARSAYEQLIAAKRELRAVYIKKLAIERRLIWLRNRVLSQIQPAALGTLSPRERQICDCLIIGMVNKEIAVKFGMSVSTVKFHVSAILKKFGMQSRRQVYGMVV